jgi:hypothetical protein
LWAFVTSLFFRRGVVSSTPNPQAGDSPLVGCPRLFIQYIRSYPPYLEDVSSIRNLRTRHAVVTRDPLNMDCRITIIYYVEVILHVSTFSRSSSGVTRNQTKFLNCLNIDPYYDLLSLLS